jgi:hypothetical protein
MEAMVADSELIGETSSAVLGDNIYVTKDSGQREEFDTGAVRDVQEGKGRYDLISFYALHRLAGLYERGAVKYSERNWEKGVKASRCLSSALRHIAQYMMGMKDEDHLAGAAWNIFAVMHFEQTMPEMIDIPGQQITTEKVG